jgi:hypothetical protein
MPVRSRKQGADGPSPGHPGHVHTFTPASCAAGVRVTCESTYPGGGITTVRSPR